MESHKLTHITHNSFRQATESFIVPPPEKPGLDIKLNWSLAGDDITPYGDAYRNADSGVLGKSSKSKPASSGDIKILEAGDTVSFDTFDEHLDDIKKNLVRQVDLSIYLARLSSVAQLMGQSTDALGSYVKMPSCLTHSCVRLSFASSRAIGKI